MVCGLVCSTSSGFSSGFLLLSMGGFWPQVPLCVCVCAWLGAFGISTGEGV